MLTLAGWLAAEGNMIIILPKPSPTKQVLEECIRQRRSVRSFQEDALSLDQISNLLWACQGITDAVWKFRTAPSAGATFPLELTVVKQDGVFRYIPLGHKLARVSEKDVRSGLAAASWNQEFIKEAPAVFIITAIYSRTTARYDERGLRYVHIEVGHAAQNLHLMAVALGLGSVPVGAFNDDEVKKILKLAKDEIPLYLIPVGRKKA